MVCLSQIKQKRWMIKYSRRDNIADSAHFRETAKDAGAA